MTDHRIKSATIGFFLLLIFFIKAIWNGILFLFSFLGESEDEEVDPALSDHYNYRTGQVDSFHRSDGLYDKRFSKDNDSI